MNLIECELGKVFVNYVGNEDLPINMKKINIKYININKKGVDLKYKLM